MTYNFKINKKGLTDRGANYFALDVEIEDGVWQKATYFGNTTPTEVTAIQKHVNKTDGSEYYTVEIQKHTSRDRDTGRFTNFKRATIKEIQ